MYLNLKNGLATVAMLTTVVMGLGSRAAFADSADQNNGESQMNHEQMMNSNGKPMQMQMQECSNNPDAQMNHEQMSSSEHQMSMKQCSDNPNTQMNHEQMMNSDGKPMKMPNNDTSSPKK